MNEASGSPLPKDQAPSRSHPWRKWAGKRRRVSPPSFALVCFLKPREVPSFLGSSFLPDPTMLLPEHFGRTTRSPFALAGKETMATSPASCPACLRENGMWLKTKTTQHKRYPAQTLKIPGTKELHSPNASTSSHHSKVVKQIPHLMAQYREMTWLRVQTWTSSALPPCQQLCSAVAPPLSPVPVKQLPVEREERGIWSGKQVPQSWLIMG